MIDLGNPKEGQLLRNVLIDGEIKDFGIVLWRRKQNDFIVCKYNTNYTTNVPDSGGDDKHDINSWNYFEKSIVKETIYDDVF
jgi:hypothetical protein